MPVRFWIEPLGDVNSASVIETVELNPCLVREPMGETICRFHVTGSPGNAFADPVSDTWRLCVFTTYKVVPAS